MAVKPRIHAAGDGALLMDVSPKGQFDLQLQKRLWSLVAEDRLRSVPGVKNLVLGVNNLLVMFRPLQLQPQDLSEQLLQAWAQSIAREESGHLVEVPVRYDVSAGSELEGIARNASLSVQEVVRLHSSIDYHVACIGSVPGFPYLVGLPPELAMPRHTSPRARVPKGTVAIGGAQTGIIPMDMPSGWHALGSTDLEMFNPLRAQPCLLAAGDQVRFVARGAAA